MHNIGNIRDNFPPDCAEEFCETLIDSGAVRIERIFSRGQATPEGEWYDQDRDEWVLLVCGSAGLLFEDESLPHTLGAGDHVFIPARCRHRVAWTDPAADTVWLAVHLPDSDRRITHATCCPGAAGT